MNLGPLACEASALTTELTAHARLRQQSFNGPLTRLDRLPGPVDAEDPRGPGWYGNEWVRTTDLALMKRPLYP